MIDIKAYINCAVLLLKIASILATTNSFAQNNVAQNVDECLLKAIKESPADTSIGEVRKTCEIISKPKSSGEIKQKAVDNNIGALALRESVEDLSSNAPFILNSYRANYLLPAVYIESPNSEPFDEQFGPNSLKKTEVQFQISLKAPIVNSLFFETDSLWVGYSMRAFWQAYSANNSRPFRDTNHEPELIWQTESHLSIWGFDNINNQVVLNHQSNGQSGDLSRSWNRLILNSAWEKNKLAFSASIWDRLKEKSDKDENPDIETFIGNAQIMLSYGQDNHRVSTMIRGNPERGKGAAEVTWSFPIHGSKKIRGMVKYFDGYGESLLDYDVRTRSFGVGFQVTDWF